MARRQGPAFVHLTATCVLLHQLAASQQPTNAPMHPSTSAHLSFKLDPQKGSFAKQHVLLPNIGIEHHSPTMLVVKFAELV